MCLVKNMLIGNIIKQRNTGNVLRIKLGDITAWAC